MNRAEPQHKTRKAKIWSMVLLIMIALLGWEVMRGIEFETNILKLLPPTERNPHTEKAVTAFAEQVSRRVVFLVNDQDAAVEVGTLLENAAPFSDVQLKADPEEDRHFFETFFPYRENLVTRDSHALIDQARQLLYSPMSSAFSQILEEDPLLLFPAFLQNLPEPPGTIHRTDGFLTVKDGEQTFYLIQAEMQGSPFARGDQQPAVASAHQILATIQDHYPTAEIYTTGMVYFATAGARSAEREASLISSGSIVGVLLLMLITFRSFRHIALSLLPIATGFLCAFSISFLIFPKVHLITLGFGASLIGVCVDYSFHYFAEQFATRKRWDAIEALRNITPGITLGLITSVMGYIGLLIAPFPGLRQMALFSSVGLLGAFGTVYCWYPRLIPAPKTMSREPLLLRLSERLTRKPIPLKTIAGIVLLLSIIFIPRLQPNDDIRLLQNPNPKLVEQETKIRALMGGVDGARFLVVEGESAEEVLQREEQLVKKLAPLKADGTIGFYQGVSTFIPSINKQHASRATLKAAIEPLTLYMSEMGFADPAITAARERILKSESKNITPEMLATSPALKQLRHLWLGETDGQYASIVMLGDVRDLSRLEILEKYPGISYVDKVRDVSEILGRYRHFAGKAVLASYAAIALFLFLRYGWHRFLRVFFPPCMAALLTLSILSALGEPINIFHYLGILLVLGIGIDYTLFFAESRSGNRTIMLAVLLSAATTILSFGLLGLSSTQALSGFGKTVFLGILFALVFSPAAGIQSAIQHDAD